MAFNVLNDFEKVERIIKENQDNNEINISDYSFISPSTLLPLIHYMEENNISNIYSSDEKIQEYIYSVLGKKEQCDNIIHIQRLKKLDNDIIKGTFISLRLNNEKFNETSYELTKIERL